MKSILTNKVMEVLSINLQQAQSLISQSKELYVDRMNHRFTTLKVAERLKRTNPFLLRIRGFSTTTEWAESQVTSSLFASEEEAVGHLLEAIAKVCHPNSKEPTYPDDLDYEVVAENRYYVAFAQSPPCPRFSTQRNLAA